LIKNRKGMEKIGFKRVRLFTRRFVHSTSLLFATRSYRLYNKRILNKENFKQWFIVNYWQWQELIYCKLIVEIYVQYNILKILRLEAILPLQIHAEKTLAVLIWIKPSSDENRIHPSCSWLSHSLSLSAPSACCHTDRPSTSVHTFGPLAACSTQWRRRGHTHERPCTCRAPLRPASGSKKRQIYILLPLSSPSEAIAYAVSRKTSTSFGEFANKNIVSFYLCFMYNEQ